jgi:hypothetical protein
MEICHSRMGALESSIKRETTLLSTGKLSAPSLLRLEPVPLRIVSEKSVRHPF